MRDVLGEQTTERATTITIAIEGGYPLDRAALAALIASLPGLRVAGPGSDPPPRVIVYLSGPDGLTSVSRTAPGAAILFIVENVDEIGDPDCPNRPAGLFSKRRARR
jgi:hypothetical protein